MRRWLQALRALLGLGTDAVDPETGLDNDPGTDPDSEPTTPAPLEETRPMLFTLEALNAKKGDALLLHWGESAGEPRLAIIDGGPGGVWRRTLRPRLRELQENRVGDAPLPVDLLMVSHIDDDHINGVLDLTRDLLDDQLDDREPWLDVTTLWHNAFDDLVGNVGDELLGAMAQRLAGSGGDAVAAGFGRPLSADGSLVLASVRQGRQLAQDARALAWNLNAPFGGLILAPGDGRLDHDLGDGLKLTIIGPDRERLEELQEEWDKELPKLLEKERREAEAEAAAYLDESVANLASLVVLAEAGGSTMLLTGDARGDVVLRGLEAAGLLEPPDGTLALDLLKLPHHGSDRNVDTDFFRRLPARHYVVSGDGTHHNPEIACLEMIAASRDDDDFTLWLTNREPRLEEFFAAERARGREYEVVFRDDDALSLRVELGGAELVD